MAARQPRATSPRDDDAFRITGLTDTSPGAANWNCGYDTLDRLTSGTSPSVTRGWTYDANGNRLTETGTAASTYTLSPSSNRIASIAGALARGYAYDAAGNTTGYSTVTAAYNNAGRLQTLTNGGSTETSTYNALGQRIEISGGVNGTVLYTYDEAGHLLGEYNAAGALIEETVWLADIPVATLKPSGTTVAIYYVHSDQLNTPRQVTRPSDNTPMWTWNSDPFGTDAANPNPGGAGAFVYNLRFPGQIFDGQAGLHQNYFRDFDPAIGRYGESDPIGLATDIDTYTYSLNGPISLNDPTGLDVSININRQGISASGNSVYGSFDATSTVLPLLPVQGLTMENNHAGDCGCKAPIPAGTYDAFVRHDHQPNRVELRGVTGYKNIQIHNGSYPRDFKGCFGVGNTRGLDFLGGSRATLQQLLNLIYADGSGRITVNVNSIPLGPTIQTTPHFGFSLP